VLNAKSVHALAKKLGVEMPISEMVYRVLYEGQAPRTAVSELMTREIKAEI
jgi:glycerol-3-phosphate dehydrogenase (NAD(P)+)